jgi:hypothetical protein
MRMDAAESTNHEGRWSGKPVLGARLECPTTLLSAALCGSLGSRALHVASAGGRAGVDTKVSVWHGPRFVIPSTHTRLQPHSSVAGEAPQTLSGTPTTYTRNPAPTARFPCHQRDRGIPPSKPCKASPRLAAPPHPSHLVPQYRLCSFVPPTTYVLA